MSKASLGFIFFLFSFFIVNSARAQSGYQAPNYAPTVAPANPTSTPQPTEIKEKKKDDDDDEDKKEHAEKEEKEKKDHDLEINVKEKRHKTAGMGSKSEKRITKEEMQALPGGDQTDVTNMVAKTTAGTMTGPGGQLFFRGTYEAAVQYQIDGVPLPDLASARFGEVISGHNVERFDIISGGFPAEYGEKLGGIINIVTKSGGTEAAAAAEAAYGSFNELNTNVSYSNSNPAGNLHYIISGGYNTTNHGLMTPEPTNDQNPTLGGNDVVHDYSTGNNQFVKIDWLANDDDKFTFLFFNVYHYFQIPNFPAGWSPNDPVFINGDNLGNSPVRYVPPQTGDAQAEGNIYGQLSWKHKISDTSFLQIVPFWKESEIIVNNDPVNDLAFVHNGQTYSSFAENNVVFAGGIQADYTARFGDEHRFKAGVLAQKTTTGGNFTVIQAKNTASNTSLYNDSNSDTQYLEAIYAQDDYTPWKPLTFNVGLRYDSQQLYLYDGETPSDYSVQPRVGASYAITDALKVHAFYGRLYHNAPLVDLRAAFNFINGTALTPWDLKSENDDYYELGLATEFATNHVAELTAYYRYGVNWLDDSVLLNTYLVQPVNFANGYSQGLDFSVKGPVTEDHRMNYFFNYSYMKTMVEGLTGGVFTQTDFTNYYTPLDSSQTHTISSGLTYAMPNSWWAGIQGLYGSGLPSGPNNSLYLPAHAQMDLTAGYNFKWEEHKFKVSADLTNVFDYMYPITVANGLTGSSFNPGRVWHVRLEGEL